jgi:hypothetical protein
VEFKTRVGARDFGRLSLEPPSAIHHRRLESRLPKVREPIRFIEIDDSKPRLISMGRFSLGKGVVGWVIGRMRVKRLFDGLVTKHLLPAKEIAEGRTVRMNVHARSQERTL